MVSLVVSLLELLQDPSLSFEKSLDTLGATVLLEQPLKGRDLFLDEDLLPSDTLVIMGYVKDLQYSFLDWLQQYEEKQDNDVVRLYTMPLAEVNNMVNLPNGPIYPGQSIHAPHLSSPYVQLPIKQSAIQFITSIQREAEIPSEFMDFLFTEDAKDLTDSFLYYMGDELQSASFPPMEIMSFLTSFIVTGTSQKTYYKVQETIELMCGVEEAFMNFHLYNPSRSAEVLRAQDILSQYQGLV